MSTIDEREPARTGQVELPDGRRLGWAEWGPPDGKPVLLCHGAALGRGLGFATAAADALGVRLVTADRPGLGASDPAPGRTLLDWPRDVAALGLEAPRVVGFSQGAPFALACGAAGVARSVTVVAGTDELAHPAFADAHDPQLRGMLQAAAADPARFEAELAAMMTPETFLRMLGEMSDEVDRGLYEAPALGRALHEGLAPGAAGYARDTVLALTPWPFRAEDIRVPVELWYGERDRSPAHSPDRGATLARRIPGARRHMIADDGGAILWTHGEEILRSLATSPEHERSPA